LIDPAGFRSAPHLLSEIAKVECFNASADHPTSGRGIFTPAPKALTGHLPSPMAVLWQFQCA